jgi:hypothetical protein
MVDSKVDSETPPLKQIALRQSSFRMIKSSSLVIMGASLGALYQQAMQQSAPNKACG